MHSGPLSMLRLYMLNAKSWQQLVICAILIAVGAVLIAMGRLTGILPILFGLILSVPATLTLGRRGWLAASRRLHLGRDQEP